MQRMKPKFLLLFLLFFPFGLLAQDSLIHTHFNVAAKSLDIKWDTSVLKTVRHLAGARKTQTEIALGRAAYYFPLFDSVLTKHGLPTDLKYVALASSELQFDYFDTLNGARGIWHFSYGQAKLFDLKITSYIDERLDPVLATEAFARAMIEYQKIYQNWSLSLAAFMSSAPKVNKAIRYHHDSSSYWTIRKDLEPNAAAIVARTAAMSILLNRPVVYKLKPQPFLPAKFGKKIYVHDWCSLDYLSAKAQLPIAQLTFLNPTYKRHVIPDMLDSFPLILPESLKDSAKWVKSLHYEPYDAYYFTGKKPKKDVKYDTVKYTVKEGDNLSGIATTYLVSVEDIMEWNELEDEELAVDQALLILLEVKISVPKPAPTPNYRVHTVRSGDTLGAIAGRYHCSVNDIKRWNNLKSTVIRPGQKLKLY